MLFFLFRLINFFAILILLASCSLVKKNHICQKTNWNVYGQDLALRGKRIDQNDFLKMCKEKSIPVDEVAFDLGYHDGIKKYCSVANVDRVGTRGEYFNYGLCNFKSEDKMRIVHSQGLEVYCVKSNGFKFGKTGAIYNNICPDKLEKAFVSEFDRGRRQFLMEKIREKQSQIEIIDQDTANIRLEQARLSNELVGENGHYIDEAADKMMELKQDEKNRQVLANNIDNTEENIKNLQKKKSNLIDYINELKLEVIKADGKLKNKLRK